MTDSRDKIKEQSDSMKKAYTVMQAYISIDSWKVIDAHLQTIVQKGTQDEYFGVADADANFDLVF